jgi:hypothetical protein
MRLSTLLAAAGCLAIGFGLAFLLAPAPTLAPYGVSTDAAGLQMSRFFGAALLQTGLVLLLSRAVTEPSTRRGIVLGAFLGSIAGLAVALAGQLAALANGLGWSTVAIYGLLLLGFGSFLFSGKAA